jgi:hypothetical protein
MSTRANKQGFSKRFATTVILALSTFSLSSSTAFSQEVNVTLAKQSFDGVWWDGAQNDEKVGFLYALEDCLTSDAKLGLVFDGTWDRSIRQIDEYFRSSASKTISVQDVFKRQGKPRGSQPLEPRYGDEFWRARNDGARRGFVEGYVSCRSSIDHVSRWPRSVDDYLKALDDMYNVDDRFGEKGPEFSGSVAEALQKLSDMK